MCPHCPYQATAKTHRAVDMMSRLHLKKCKFKDVDEKDKPSDTRSNEERAASVKQLSKAMGMSQVKVGQNRKSIEIDYKHTSGIQTSERLVKL